VVDRLLRLLLVLWAGSLWSTVWVALTVFHIQPDRHLAGLIAARLFAVETYLGLAVAAIAALQGERSRFGYCYLAAALLAFNEWVLKRIMDQALATGSALGLGFGPWHGVSALVYLAACLSVTAYAYKNLQDSRDNGIPR
jgi:hypothetical protein